MDLFEFKAGLVYRVSSRTAGTTQKILAGARVNLKPEVTLGM